MGCADTFVVNVFISNDTFLLVAAACSSQIKARAAKDRADARMVEIKLAEATLKEAKVVEAAKLEETKPVTFEPVETKSSQVDDIKSKQGKKMSKLDLYAQAKNRQLSPKRGALVARQTSQPFVISPPTSQEEKDALWQRKVRALRVVS